MKGKETHERQELRKRVVAVAMEAFLAEGIRPVRMDDIAARLSISKRTIYEMFPDKESLVLECVRHRHSKLQETMTALSRRTENILEIILCFYIRQLEELRHTNSRFLEDIKKYPAVLNHIRENREKNRQASVEFFRKGVEQGLFRDDLDMGIVIRLMSLQGGHELKDEAGRAYPLDEVFRTFIHIYLHGISTDKGREVFRRIITEYEQQNQIKINL